VEGSTQQSASELVVSSTLMQLQQLFTPLPALIALQSQVIQPTQNQMGQQGTVPKPKKVRKSLEPSSSNEKTKNSSLSEKRGSIVKSIDKLASSIASNEISSAATASSLTMMPMLMVMQMQQQQVQMMQQQMEFQWYLLHRYMEMQIKGVGAQVKGQGDVMMKVLEELKKREKKECKKRKKKKARKRRATAEADADKNSSSGSSSSSNSSSFYHVLIYG
jgi:hypothetical protein